MQVTDGSILGKNSEQLKEFALEILDFFYFKILSQEKG